MSAIVTRKSLFSIADVIPQLNIVAVREGDNVAHVAPSANDEPGRSAEAVSSSSSPSADCSAADGLSQLRLDGRVSSAFLCSSCAVAFDIAEELRDHAKSGWHVHNMQQTSAGKAAITEQQCAALPRSRHRSSPSAQQPDGSQHTDAADASSSSDDEELTAALSVVGAEEQAEEETLAGSPRVVFSTPTQRIAVWKALLVHPRSTSSSSSFSTRSALYLSSFRSLPSVQRMGVFLCMGGRFAAALFSSASPTVHRAFQRYTTRRQQGGSQASNDAAAGAGHQARSIGSSIRRKETVRFIAQVHEVMAEWQAELQRCQLLFLFAPSLNRRIFFSPALAPVRDSGGAMVERDVSWQKDDSRIRGVPFSVYRPTFAEVQRVHAQLSSVEFSDATAADGDADGRQDVAAAAESGRQQEDETAGTAPPSPPPEPDLVLAAIDTNDVQQLQQLCASQYQRPVPAAGITALVSPVYYACVQRRLSLLPFLLSPAGGAHDINEQSIASLPSSSSSSSTVCWSALHYAAACCLCPLLLHLLDLGADPTVRDSRGLTPYAAAPAGEEGKEVRAAMRRWAGEADHSSWDWSKAGFVPTKLRTEEEEEERRRAVREKEKEKKARQKARQKAQREEERQQSVREEEQRRQRDSAQAEQGRRAEEEKKAALAMEQAWQARERSLQAMSDREKRAMAAERRMQAMRAAAAGGAAMAGCDACGQPLVRVPFERLHYKYDTLLCLQKHRQELEKRQEQQLVNNR